MNKILVIAIMGLFLIGLASSYICIYPSTDNKEVQDFKARINNLAIQKDIDTGLTEDALMLKLKYFGPCR